MQTTERESLDYIDYEDASAYPLRKVRAFCECKRKGLSDDVSDWYFVFRLYNEKGNFIREDRSIVYISDASVDNVWYGCPLLGLFGGGFGIWWWHQPAPGNNLQAHSSVNIRYRDWDGKKWDSFLGYNPKPYLGKITFQRTSIK